MRFLADENFNNRILKGILKQNPDVDIVRAQDTEVYQTDDPTVLEWAANHGRIVLTHDAKTMSKFADDRVEVGLAMPGVFQVNSNMSIGQAVAELLVAIGASEPGEHENLVKHFPM